MTWYDNDYPHGAGNSNLPAFSVTAQSAAVPEPVTLTMFGLGACPAASQAGGLARSGGQPDLLTGRACRPFLLRQSATRKQDFSGIVSRSVYYH